MQFKIGDRVVSRGIYSKMFGIGKITAIKLNVATVVFDDSQAVESFHFSMLKNA